MMMKLNVFWAVLCALFATAQAFRGTEHAEATLHADDAPAPGCACAVNTCFKQRMPNLWQEVVQGTSEDARASVHFRSGEYPACGLLALSPNFHSRGAGENGPDGKHINDTRDVCTALGHDFPQPGFPLVGLLAEPGACSELPRDSCPQVSGPGHGYPAHAIWSKDWYYHKVQQDGVVNKCHNYFVMQNSSDENRFLHFAAQCEPQGMKLRAQWDVGRFKHSHSFVCDSKLQLDTDMLVTADHWTPAPMPGLPRWTCVDVPDHGILPKYRLLAYSFGPMTCGLPPREVATRQGSSSSSNLGSLTLLIVITLCGVLCLAGFFPKHQRAAADAMQC
mmetsp:Transcript_59955/g.111155  ORF Transcript_59955/g.111155 Transcript_59955/m.111155 type:complete len:334 (+) Transcript_59955:71-1072(+)